MNQSPVIPDVIPMRRTSNTKGSNSSILPYFDRYPTIAISENDIAKMLLEWTQPARGHESLAQAKLFKLRNCRGHLGTHLVNSLGASPSVSFVVQNSTRGACIGESYCA